MEHFEFDVDLRVRRTLRMTMRAGTSETEARKILQALLDRDGFIVSTLTKWEVPGGAFPPVPVERLMGRKRTITAVRHVTAAAPAKP